VETLQNGGDKLNTGTAIFPSYLLHQMDRLVGYRYW